MSTYSKTLDFLYSQLPAYHRIGKAAYKNDLNNSIALDNYFGNPHKKFRTIHVAGTNGKGSVSHMIASVLQEAGYKTGLYTSPHLIDFRERIKVNGKMIPEQSVIDFVSEHKEIIESLTPSFFELTVAMAYNYFAESIVDIAVIEVGLGGRLDSTNIITPVLSVITNIGHDHMDLLGDTLEKIAVEKAGIIKKNIPVVISETDILTKQTFLSRAEETNSPISFADERFTCILEENDKFCELRQYKISDLISNKEYEGCLDLGGDYQSPNLKAVFGVFNQLSRILAFSEINISEGLKKVVENTGLKGRWQILGKEPLIICDTGHNREGLEQVIEQLQRIHKNQLHIIIGFVNDKDLKSVLPLFPIQAKYYFTKASIPRALDEKILQSEALKFSLSGDSYPDVSTAYSEARKSAEPSDLIFIGGSTFIVAEVIN